MHWCRQQGEGLSLTRQGKQGSGKSDANSSNCGQRAAGGNGQMEELWWRAGMRRSQEVATEIRTFIAKGEKGRESVCKLWNKWSSGKGRRGKIKAVGEVGSIRGGDLGE